MSAFLRRILVVEDEGLMSALLLKVLEESGFQVRTAGDVLEARRLVDQFDPDAALLDIDLGDGPSGLDLAHALHVQYPHIALVFLTKHPDLRSAGVPEDRLPEHCGFLRKDILRQHFSDAELADLALTVSLWNALTRFQRVMGVESDRARPPRGTDPGERQHFPSVYRTQL